MSREHALVVDDEEDIRELLEYSFLKHGYKVTCVSTGEKAIEVARAKLPDVVILDVMLPGVDGIEVAKILKNDPRTRQIPIIMLTARTGEADIVTGLELGADDYVTKPFSPRVLLARVKAALRKKGVAETDSEAVIKTHDLVMDPTRHEALLKGEPMDLTHTEFSLLHLLAGRPGRVFTRQQIIDSIKGVEYAVTDRSVDVQVAGLRKKLGPAGDYIETVRGVGYRFKE